MRAALILPVFLASVLGAAEPVRPVAPTLRVTAQGIELSVSADGTPPLEYLWRIGVTVKRPIPGGNGPVLLLRPPYAPQAGLIDVVVSNSAGSVTSAPVRLSVTTQPEAAPVTIVVQEAKNLATGAGPLTTDQGD